MARTVRQADRPWRLWRDAPVPCAMRYAVWASGRPRRRLMASIDSMNALLVDELRDIYDAEKRLTKAIPKMAKKAENEELRSALEEHLQETQGQIARLEEAFEHLGEKAKGKPCAGMKGIIEEGEEHMSEDYEDDD